MTSSTARELVSLSPQIDALTGPELHAFHIAKNAFKDVTDKQGAPYLHHITAVRRNLVNLFPECSVTTRAAALLHDILEDTSWTADALRGQGVPEGVVDQVKTVTRPEGPDRPTYMDWIRETVAASPAAAMIKLADNVHNDDPERNAGLAASERRYIPNRRYQKARAVLRESLQSHGYAVPDDGDIFDLVKAPGEEALVYGRWDQLDRMLSEGDTTVYTRHIGTEVGLYASVLLSGNPTGVRLYLHHGAPIERMSLSHGNWNNKSPLSVCIFHQAFGSIRPLLEHGADPNDKTGSMKFDLDTGSTLVDLILEKPDDESDQDEWRDALDAMIAHGAELEFKGKTGSGVLDVLRRSNVNVDRATLEDVQRAWETATRRTERSATDAYDSAPGFGPSSF